MNSGHLLLGCSISRLPIRICLLLQIFRRHPIYINTPFPSIFRHLFHQSFFHNCFLIAVRASCFDILSSSYRNPISAASALPSSSSVGTYRTFLYRTVGLRSQYIMRSYLYLLLRVLAKTSCNISV
jgi:hypothetical protein